MVARRTGLRGAALFAALLAVATARSGRADDPRGEARAHYARGLELAGQNGYEGALREFNAAYAISPQFAVLFNIGQAHIALGHTIEAIAALTRYLTDGGDWILAPPADAGGTADRRAALHAAEPGAAVRGRGGAGDRGGCGRRRRRSDRGGVRGIARRRNPTGDPDRPLPRTWPQADARRQADRSRPPRAAASLFREGSITSSCRPPEDAPPKRVSRLKRGARRW